MSSIPTLFPSAIPPLANFANDTKPFWAVNGGAEVEAEQFIGTNASQAPFVANVPTSASGASFAGQVLEINNSAVAGDPTRWAMLCENAETGANAGSDLVFRSYDDTGVSIKDVVTLSRLGQTYIQGPVISQDGTTGNSRFTTVVSGNGANSQLSSFLSGGGNGASQLLLQGGVSPLSGSYNSFSLTTDANTGYTTAVVSNRSNTQQGVFNVVNDDITTDQQLGQVSFFVSPQIANDSMNIPYVQRGNFADTFGGSVSYTITPTNLNIFNRSNILVHVSHFFANNDTANSCTVSPVLQVETYTSQTGNSYGQYQTSGINTGNTQDYLLVFGTHYNSASTSLTITYTVTGRIVNNTYSVSMLGLC